MTDDDRIAALERRVAALEATASALPPVGTDSVDGEGRVPAADFWALGGVKARHADLSAGAVLFTGAVGTPDGARYEWQETRPADELLDDAWDEVGTALAALAGPVRMRLLREVLGGRGTAAELAGLADFGTSGQVYHHLRQLTAAGWLRAAGRGRYVVPPERVVPLLAVVAAVRR